jgi:hypothetical protein
MLPEGPSEIGDLRRAPEAANGIHFPALKSDTPAPATRPPIVQPSGITTWAMNASVNKSR